MAVSYTGRKRVRKNFGKIPFVAEMPNLIEVQKASYDKFVKTMSVDGCLYSDCYFLILGKIISFVR